VVLVPLLNLVMTTFSYDALFVPGFSVYYPARWLIVTCYTALFCASLAQGPSWDEEQLLVDSGSEHPPLISTRMAKQLGPEVQVVGAPTRQMVTFCHCTTW